MAAYTALSGAALSLAGTTGCALHGASLFLVWPRKSNQKEGHPDIRPFAARRVPSLHRRSRGTLRRAIPGPSQLSRHPCRSTPSTPPALGLLKGAIRWCLIGRAAKRLWGLQAIVGWVTRSLPTEFLAQGSRPIAASIAVENAPQFSTLRSPPKIEALCCCCHSRTSRRLGPESPSGGRA